MKSEFELIQHLKKKLPKSRTGELGIGDDAALLNIKKGCELAVSSDVIVDGVDFLSSKASAKEIGRKALAVNLSDLAAMGAKPKAFFVTLGLTKKQRTKWVKDFYEGMKPLSRKYQCVCLGGDFSSSKTLFAAITILGEVPKAKALRRDKARAGDLLAVTGSFGGSICSHHLYFEPRVREGQYLASKKYIRAGLDVSDGLLQDLNHLLEASKVGAKLFLDRIPVSEDARKLSKKNISKALKRALGDGEDFELLFTVPKSKRKYFNRIGKRNFHE